MKRWFLWFRCLDFKKERVAKYNFSVGRASNAIWLPIHALYYGFSANDHCCWEELILQEGRVQLLPFKNRCAPSKHSGESSLSPNEPNNSLTRISACEKQKYSFQFEHLKDHLALISQLKELKLKVNNIN